MNKGIFGNWYVKLRIRMPDKLVSLLKEIPLVARLAKSLQPRPGSVELYELSEPLNGFRMFIPSNYVYTMVWGEYDPEVCRFLEGYLKPGWTVVDAGSHIGYFSLLMAKCVAQDGCVLSFEPLSENLCLLYNNIALNKMHEIIRVVPMAIADRSHLCRLYYHQTSSQAFLEGTAEIDVSDKGYEVVAAVSLDEYMDAVGWPTVNLVKMDIEGAESLAVMGMKETLRRNSPAVLMETHGENARQGLRYLAVEGYTVYKLERAGLREIHDLENIVIANERWLLLP
ncbi:MAG: FkbM family methyltransferase [Candidatus Methanomethylicaceae archaeon]